MGGQWIGAKQYAALALIREFGLVLQPQYNAGKRVLQLNNIVKTYKGLIPNASVGVLIDAQITLLLVWLLQCIVWLSPAGCIARWADGLTVAQLTQRVMCTVGGRTLVRIVVQGLFGFEPEDVSVLAFLRYINASGSVEPMTEIGPGTLQCWTVVGGTQQISLRLAERFSRNGGTLLFDHRVTAARVLGADAAEGPVQVTCTNGSVHHADAIVFAIPPPLARSIALTPALDPARLSLMAESTMGGIIKAAAVYAEPFWRADGYSGEVVCETTPAEPAFNIFDNCLPPADPSTFPTEVETRGSAAGISMARAPLDRMTPTLVVFINGARAREWSARPAEERRAAVLQQLARWFGPRALHPIDYAEKDWVADPNTRGCPIASYGRGVLAEFGVGRKLREPSWPVAAPGGRATPRLFWAGTEVADTSVGFIDGAIVAGWKAAEDVGAALGVAVKGGPTGVPEAPVPARPARPAAGGAAASSLGPDASAALLHSEA